MSKRPPSLREKTRSSLWSYAFFRLESATIIAATLITTVLSAQGLAPWLPGRWQLWLGFGLLAEAVIVMTTVMDKKLRQRFEKEHFRGQFDLELFSSQHLRNKVLKGLEYRDTVLEALAMNQLMSQKLAAIKQELEGWLAQIYRLALQLDRYQSDSLLSRDRQQLPEDIRSLTRRLRHEDNPSVIADLEATLASKNRQMKALTSLADTMHSAELKLDSTLTAMSTLYTQTLKLNSKELAAGAAGNLQEAIHEQISSLEDISQAMDDVLVMS